MTATTSTRVEKVPTRWSSTAARATRTSGAKPSATPGPCPVRPDRPRSVQHRHGDEREPGRERRRRRRRDQGHERPRRADRLDVQRRRRQGRHQGNRRPRLALRRRRRRPDPLDRPCGRQRRVRLGLRPRAGRPARHGARLQHRARRSPQSEGDRQVCRRSGGAAAVTLRCVATKKCSGLVSLRHKGKTLATAKFAMGKKKSKTVRLKLNKRGLRLLAKAPNKGMKVQLRIDAKDAARNGWRTDSEPPADAVDVPAGKSPQHTAGTRRPSAQAGGLRSLRPLCRYIGRAGLFTFQAPTGLADAKRADQRVARSRARHAARARCAGGPAGAPRGTALRHRSRAGSHPDAMCARPRGSLFLAIYTALVVKAAISSPDQIGHGGGEAKGVLPARRAGDAAVVRALRALSRAGAAAGVGAG